MLFIHSLVATMVLLLLWAQIASADIIFNYEPGSPVAFGRSIDHRFPTDGKLDCLANSEWKWTETEPAPVGSAGGVLKIAVSGEYTSDYKEIFEKLHLNAYYKASATIEEIVKLDSEASLDLNYDFIGKYSDFAYILVARYEFGGRRLTRPVLADNYQSLIDQGKHSEFIATCGTHFVISEERWAYASIIVSIDNLDESIKRRLKTKYKGRAGVIAIGSGEFGLDIEAQYNTVHRYSAATLDFQANGGEPGKASKLAAATQASDIGAALVGMEEYMTGISRETSVPKNFRLVPFALFGLKHNEDPSVSHFLESIYFSSIRYSSTINEIRRKIDNTNSYSAEETEKLKKIYQRDLHKLMKEKAALDVLAIECVKNSVCDSDKIRSVAPMIGYRTSLLRDPEIRPVCLYHNTALEGISVRLVGRFLDPNAVQDFDVYRINEYKDVPIQNTALKRTGLNEDSSPLNRFIARIEIIEDDLESDLTLIEEARAIRYEMRVKIFDGTDQWYDLGYLNLRTDECPLVRS